jgi:hypothetical protein
LLTSLRTAQAHTLSEMTNDVDQVMATVSDHVCYVMPDFSMSDPQLCVLTTREQVRAYYQAERGMLEVVDATHVAQISSDWYVFYEGVATTRSVSNGKLYKTNHVVLFPVAEDGIVGEILWARRSFADVYADKPVPSLAAAPDGAADVPWLRWRNREVHESFLDALRDGDAARAVSAFAGDARIAVRDYTESGARVLAGTGEEVVRRRCAMIVDGLQDREIITLNHLVGDWYVFAEWVARGRAVEGALRGVPGGAHVQLRVAGIYPVTADNTLRAELGYGVDAMRLDD